MEKGEKEMESSFRGGCVERERERGEYMFERSVRKNEK